MDACIHLYRIYTAIGNELEKAEEPEKMLEFLIKAFDMAKQGQSLLVLVVGKVLHWCFSSRPLT